MSKNSKKKKSAVVIENVETPEVQVTETAPAADETDVPEGGFFNPDEDAFFPDNTSVADEDVAPLPEAALPKKRGRKKKEGGPSKPVNTVKQNAPGIPFASVVKLEANKNHEIRAFDILTGEDRTASIYFSVRKKAFAKGANLIRLRQSWKQLSDDMLEAVKVHISMTEVPAGAPAETAAE